VRDHVTVRVRIDETGDFDFRPGWWRLGLVVAVILPDRAWPAVETFVAARAAEWDVEELKAKDMTTSQRLEVVDFIVSHELTVVAVGADSELFPMTDQRRWRTDQTAVFEAAVDRSTRAKSDPEVQARVARTRRFLSMDRLVSSPDYLQYAIIMPRLVADAASAALCAYRRMEPARDGWGIDILADAKKGADPGRAGRLLRDITEPILAGDKKLALGLPVEWPPDHPFILRNADPVTGTIPALKAIGGGVRSAGSETDPGLQLAGTAAHVILRALRDPGDGATQTAWRMLRRRRFAFTPFGIRLIHRRREVLARDIPRYRHIIG
jgi:hypothetical protein